MSREIKEGNSSSGSSSSSSGSSNNNRSGASSTMRKDTSLPPSACPVSPPALSARKQHDGKFVKFCPDDLQRVIGGVGLSSTGESSSSCLLVLQESDSVSTADSTSCSSLSNEASSSSSSSNISTSHHHCPTTPSQTGLLRHRTSRDYSATLPLLANDTATISLVVEDGDLVDAQDYSPKHQQHPQHQHHQDHHHSFAQHYVSFKNKTSRRDLLNHVICSKKNCIVVAAHHQKQRLMTPRIILTWMLMMGMMLSLVVLDSYSSPYYGYYYFSSSSTSSSTTTTPPLPRLPSLLLTTTTTSDVSSGSENHHPLAMSARDTQKLLQKINHASSSSSLSSSTTTNKSKKQKNHHHHHHFTLRLQGSRVDLLHMSLDQHATCPGVAHVQIDWTGPSPFVVTRRSDNDNIIVESSSSSSIILQQDQKREQEQSDDAAAFVPFTLLHHASHKVGPVDAATTHAAVFLLHERLSLDCGDLTRAFAEWKKEPTRMVGFFPLLQPPPPPPPPSLRQEAVSIVRSRNNHDDDKMNARRNNYSLLSDRALFVHKLYLPEAMRTVLRQESSHVCREYMLAARIAAISNQAPVAMTLQNHHHYHHHFDEENVARLVPSRRMKEATTDGIDRLDCLPLLLEAVGKVSLPATDAVYIGRDVRPPSTNTASSGGGDKINDGPP
jgi:Glycosyl transferase family 64 domain